MLLGSNFLQRRTYSFNLFPTVTPHPPEQRFAEHKILIVQNKTKIVLKLIWTIDVLEIFSAASNTQTVTKNINTHTAYGPNMVEKLWISYTLLTYLGFILYYGKIWHIFKKCKKTCNGNITIYFIRLVIQIFNLQLDGVHFACLKFLFFFILCLGV
jgi:hypothetical protein